MTAGPAMPGDASPALPEEALDALMLRSILDESQDRIYFKDRERPFRQGQPKSG